MAGEVQEAIMLLHFIIQGTAVGAKAIMSVPKGAAKLVKGGKTVVDTISLKKLQFRMLSQYKNQGVYETMTLKDMEQITGGDYRIVRIPIEKGMEDYEEEAIRFFDAVKTLKIPFAEMPDINIGDGYMEIAINPQDASRLSNLVQEYNFPYGKAEEVSMDDYLNHARDEDYQAYQQEAVRQAEEMLKKNEPPKEPPPKGEYVITANAVLWKSPEFKELKKIGEKEGVIYVRLPKNFVGGEYREEFLKIPEGACEFTVQNNVLRTRLNTRESYQLYDRFGNPTRMVSGISLTQNWDAVEENPVRTATQTRQNLKEEAKALGQVPLSSVKELEVTLEKKFAKTLYFEEKDIAHEGELFYVIHLPGFRENEFITLKKEQVKIETDGSLSCPIQVKSNYHLCRNRDGKMEFRTVDGNMILSSALSENRITERRKNTEQMKTSSPSLT